MISFMYVSLAFASTFKSTLQEDRMACPNGYSFVEGGVQGDAISVISTVKNITECGHLCTASLECKSFEYCNSNCQMAIPVGPAENQCFLNRIEASNTHRLENFTFCTKINDSPYNSRHDFCNHDDLSAIESQRPVLVDIQNKIMSCLNTNTDSDVMSKCILKKERSEHIRTQCRKCIINFISCIASKCDLQCVNSNTSPDNCEVCAKTNKCSIDICTNPNYLFPI